MTRNLLVFRGGKVVTMTAVRAVGLHLACLQDEGVVRTGVMVGKHEAVDPKAFMATWRALGGVPARTETGEWIEP